MKLSGRLFTVSILLQVISVPVALSDTSCDISPIDLTLSGGQIDGAKIILNDGVRAGDPNSNDGALTWDEPMELQHADGSLCTVSPDVGIIAEPMYNAENKYLYVITYSGSNSILYVVAIHNCAVSWQSPVLTSFPTFSSGRFLFPAGVPPVSIGPDCLPRLGR